MSKNPKDVDIPLLDRWAKVFDKSLATPVPTNLTLKKANTLELEDFQEDISENVDLAVGHVFKRSTAYACPRHVRERMAVSEDKPVKLVNAMKPPQVKAVTQARKQLAAKEKSPIETLLGPKSDTNDSKQEAVKEVPKERPTDIRPLLSHATPAHSKRQASSKARPHLERERSIDQVTEPVKPVVPGGEPITLELAKALRVLLFGTPYTSFNSEWRKQHINFFTNLSYALSFYKVGPDGVMACLQGFLLRQLLYEQPTIEHVKSMLTPMASDRQKALITAMVSMLWQAGGLMQATVALPCGECNWLVMDDYREDQLTEKLHLFQFNDLNDLERFMKKQLSFFESTNGNGCILLLYSVILSRTVERVIEDLGDENATLMGIHDSCSQAMVNLLLTGRAAPNVFNGDIEYNKHGRKLSHPLNGIRNRSEIGFLSLEEHLDPKSFQVGSMLKTPRFPVWVIKTGLRFGVMFSLNKDLVNDWRLERRFELHRCTGSAKRNSLADECIYIVDTRDVFSPHDEFGEEPTDEENCLRTKWPEAVIELKEAKS